MPKVVYAAESIAPYVVGGMQTVARRHIRYLQDAGHELTVLHSRISADAADKLCDPAFRRIPWPGEKRRWRYPGQYAGELQRYSREVRKQVSRLAPDVVYAEGPVVDALFSLTKRPPIIFHPHGLEIYQQYAARTDILRLFFLKRLIARHCRQADYVISQGGQLTEILRNKAGTAEYRIRLLPNIFDGEPDEPKKKEENKLFLFVGRNEKRKGLGLLLDVIAGYPELTFEVVGSRPPGGDVPENIRSHGVINDQNTLAALYRKAYVLVVPSLAEGMPTVILEAMGRGTPVIASNVGAVAELVINGKTGWCITPGSRNELEYAVREAVAISGQEYQRLSENCIQLVKEKFSEQAVRPLLCALIEEAVITSCNH